MYIGSWMWVIFKKFFHLIQVMFNFDESTKWKPCFVVSDVDLPTGYYFGFTAATGDLCGKPNKLQGHRTFISPPPPHNTQTTTT